MTDYSKYEFIQVEKQDKVGIVTLNRPEVLNAINDKMHTEVAHIFEDLGSDDEVNAVVLTGAGRAFCAGGDVRAMANRVGEATWGDRATTREAHKLINDMLDIQKPIIAAVNGAAVGLGATIALFCDVIIASERARLGDPHIKVGLVAGDGGAVIWPLMVGIHKAKEMLMTGDIIDAKEAERIGLVNRVVAAEDLMPEAMALARRLAHGPTRAIGWTKLSVNKVIKERVNLILEASLSLEGHSFNTYDHQEASKAFVEGREPQFQGR